MTASLTSLAGLAARGAAVLVLALSAAGALADDLPGRVGRLADVGGRVFVSTEERAGDWIEALRNYTVTTGDNLWVSDDGRAEVDYGGGQVRLAGDSNVHIARLDDRVLALFVAHGRVIVRIRVLEPGDAAHIDTPNTQLVLTRPGLYRIEVTPDRSRTELVVREGEATIALAGGIQQVLPGQTAEVEGDTPSYADVRNGYGTDGFDSWSANRDRRYERSRTASHVSRQMIGYADLDEYGRWDTSPQYGAVWYPTAVPIDWAPYRHGRWTWVGGFGWTWVDDAPWGYAPFHYGRWVFVGNRWGWCPGGYVARPAWAPALVGWYGGSRWSASLSFGAPVYGWVPLAWGEPYLPSWRCSHGCWTRYNRPYAVNYAERPSAPPTRYANWAAPGGVTAVAGATFTGRQPVHTNLVAVRPAAVTNAPVLAQAPMLAKPTAATIPGAKPAIGRTPQPAAAYIDRTKPMVVAPQRGVSAWSEPARGVTSVAPATRPYAAPAQSAAPSRPAPPAMSAPPTDRPRPVQAAPAPGTWGAPTAPSPQFRPSVPVQRSEPRSSDVGPRVAAPSPQVAPQRSAPPATWGSPAPMQNPRPTPMSPQLERPVAAPPAPAPAPQAARPAPQAVPVPQPQPQAPRNAPPSERPQPKRDTDKPGVQQR